MIEEIESLKKEEVRLSDDVTYLETEQNQVTNKIKLIDETLEEMKKEIKTLMKPADDTVEKPDMRKQCHFDNKGYCRETENCQFFHSDIICQVYTENGTCWKQNCRERHP